MMTIAGFPAVKVEFDKKASLVDPSVPADIHRMIEDERITDLLVLAHGWNIDMGEAQALYDELLGTIAALKATVGGTRHRTFGVLAVFWPSKKFADADLISGGAASLGSADEQLLLKMLDDLQGAFDAPDADAKLEEARALVPALDSDPVAREQFADLVRGHDLARILKYQVQWADMRSMMSQSSLIKRFKPFKNLGLKYRVSANEIMKPALRLSLSFRQ